MPTTREVQEIIDAAGPERSNANASAGKGKGSYAESSVSTLAPSVPKPVRGPDEQRGRRTWTEAAVGPAHPDHWSKFDANRFMKVLRTSDPITPLKILKELHVKWWHATEAQMVNIFRLADLPSTGIDQVQYVVGTC